jgi:hypothetical protein
LVAGSNQKSLKLMVGATGFEPATPASRTQIAVEKINKNNDLCPRLTIFISLYSRGFGDQSVVGKFEAPFAISDQAAACADVTLRQAWQRYLGALLLRKRPRQEDDQWLSRPRGTHLCWMA